MIRLVELAESSNGGRARNVGWEGTVERGEEPT